MQPLYIYGAGGLGKEIVGLVREINRVKPIYNLMGFFDDAYPNLKSVYDIDIVGDKESLKNWSEKISVVVAIGSPGTKEKIISEITNSNIDFPILIHPSVIIYDQEKVQLGEGTIISAGVCLTTEIEIGNHVLINLKTTIGHNCKIADFCSIMPGVNLAGNVVLERAVFIGAGVNIINGATIGENALIGAGAVVIDSINARKTAVGVPAREI